MGYSFICDYSGGVHIAGQMLQVARSMGCGLGEQGQTRKIDLDSRATIETVVNTPGALFYGSLSSLPSPLLLFNFPQTEALPQDRLHVPAGVRTTAF